MTTQENLMSAFAGESQANRKYLAFAKKAEQEGFTALAKLFRATAEAETVHAHEHLRVAGGIKDTITNLEEAIAGEKYECTSMYPEFIDTAEKEGNQTAVMTFNRASGVEKIHFDLYSQALESIKNGKDIEETKIYVCSVCGNTVKNEAPDICPICKASKDKFFEVK
jgi:rubrerythrin